MKLIGNQHESHTDHSNVQQSMLNAYVMIRDNWRVHEEMLGHKSFHFNFTSTPNSRNETPQHQSGFSSNTDSEPFTVSHKINLVGSCQFECLLV